MLGQSTAISEQDFEFFQEQVLQRSGIYLTIAKQDLIKSRLLPRLEKKGMQNFHEYRVYLARLPPEHEEWQEFINQITTNKTDFFRESSHFRMLTEKFLPDWIKRNPAKGARLRVWCAACSTGEEAYSLAMILRHFFKDTARFEILASDIDTTVLAHATNAVYRLSRLGEIPKEYQTEAIVKGIGTVKDWFKIQNRLKSTIRFERLNLAETFLKSPGGPFDIVFCRNVFLYFQQETIDRVCENFGEVLNKNGILVLGHSESLGSDNPTWRSQGSSVYSRSKDIEALAAKKVPQIPAAKRSPARKRVLIVDDSLTMRQLLSSSLAKSELLTVVGTVGDPRELSHAIRQHQPDVITLDLKMPYMDGCEVLEKVLNDSKIPVLIISAVTREEGPEVMRALELGAVDYMEKPTFESLKNGSAGLIERVVQAASTKVRHRQQKSIPTKRIRSLTSPGIYKHQKPLILIGASTGGIQAITEILTQLPDFIPPILIVQHIPAVFSLAFATRLDQICPFHVREAQDGADLLQNQVLIAPGGKHMSIVSNGASGLKISLSDAPPVNRHRPSVDVLFESAVAAGLGSHIVAIILTGMGNDGAAGLSLLKLHGAKTIAQDEASSAVFGMPREAIRLKAADVVSPLEKIPYTIEKLLASLTPKSA